MCVARHQAAGWHTVECDGLDAGEVGRAIDEAIADPRPSLIRCKTIIGYGAPHKQGTAATHGAALGADEVAAARKELGLGPPAFAVPDDVLDRLARGRQARRRSSMREWNDRLEASGSKDEFLARIERQGRRCLAQALSRQAARRSADGRDAQGVGNGAGGDQRRDPRDHRRLGRPDRLEQHQDQGPSSR